MRACVALLAVEFADEIAGSGLSHKAWREMETSKLLHYSSLHIG